MAMPYAPKWLGAIATHLGDLKVEQVDILRCKLRIRMHREVEVTYALITGFAFDASAAECGTSQVDLSGSCRRSRLPPASYTTARDTMVFPDVPSWRAANPEIEGRARTAEAV
jgi:hypothetical protein